MENLNYPIIYYKSWARYRNASGKLTGPEYIIKRIRWRAFIYTDSTGWWQYILQNPQSQLEEEGHSEPAYAVIRQEPVNIPLPCVNLLWEEYNRYIADIVKLLGVTTRDIDKYLVIPTHKMFERYNTEAELVKNNKETKSILALPLVYSILYNLRNLAIACKHSYEAKRRS